MVWAIVYTRDIDLVIVESAVHPIGEVQKFVLGIVTAGNACLIRNNDEEVSERLGGATELKDPFLKYEIRLRVDVPTLDIDDAVSIQEKCFPARHLRLLAPRRIGLQEDSRRRALS